MEKLVQSLIIFLTNLDSTQKIQINLNKAKKHPQAGALLAQDIKMPIISFVSLQEQELDRKYRIVLTHLKN